MTEQEMIKSWVAAWRAAGPELERLRREEVKRSDTLRGIQALSDIDLHARPPRPASGLVEQQAWFRKLRKL